MWQKASVWLLAIMSVLTITFPAIALYVVDTYQITQIEYVLGDTGVSQLHTGIYYNTNQDGVNITITDNANLQTSMGSSMIRTWTLWDGDSYHHKSGTNQWEIKDNQTIISNTNYVLHYDYKTPSQTGNYAFYWLNLTNHYIANNIDALIINWTATHGEWGMHFILGAGIGSTSNIQIDDKTQVENDTYVMIFTPSFKATLLANQDNRVWLYTTNLNHSDMSYSWSVEEADTSGLFAISPLILTEIMLLFIVVIMVIFTLFATDTIDIKIDRQTKYLKRRGG